MSVKHSKEMMSVKHSMYLSWGFTKGGTERNIPMTSPFSLLIGPSPGLALDCQFI